MRVKKTRRVTKFGEISQQICKKFVKKLKKLCFVSIVSQNLAVIFSVWISQLNTFNHMINIINWQFYLNIFLKTNRVNLLLNFKYLKVHTKRIKYTQYNFHKTAN